MKQTVLFEIKALYRDDFRVTGFTFGSGEPSICIVGSMRGNENQQLFACSRLIRKLTELEEQGRILPGKQILVIPCVNPYSMNIKKRFWTIDNTDINRMFPGYDQGETTQRIAAGVFSAIQDYQYGVQFASFYMPGAFVPHVRMMKTGVSPGSREASSDSQGVLPPTEERGCFPNDVELAQQFGLPYIVLHDPRPFDTTTLNYNWQIWETHAFSIYTTNTQRVDKVSAKQAIEAILNFMEKQEIIRYRGYSGYHSRVIESRDFIPVRAEDSGFFETLVQPGDEVDEGQLLARIYDPYLGTVRCTLHAPAHSTVAFVHDEAMTYQSTAVLKLIPEDQ
ncbi:MAG: M14 family metallopeptidase [Clostridiales bacterium]|nr:M14 family metallopeptidase [Clostridiales bacterium]